MSKPECVVAGSVALATFLLVGLAARPSVAQISKIEPYADGTESYEGACPTLSPNGCLVAIRRYVPLPGPHFGSSFGGADYIPQREDLWIRDLQSGHERLLRKDCHALHWLRDDTQVGDKAADALRKLTGKDFGRDAESWRCWWARQDGKLSTERE